MSSQEFEWLSKNMDKISKYARKHVAIVGNEIVAVDESAKVVYDRAKEKYPDKSPLIHYVHAGDVFVL
ncbi:MAG: hypothetical protein HMLIMOIP_000273 [Candidatus Nitrosomirales archaeon]|jgi:hypothetical protein